MLQALRMLIISNAFLVLAKDTINRPAVAASPRWIPSSAATEDVGDHLTESGNFSGNSHRRRKRWLLSFNPNPEESRRVQPEGRFHATAGAR